MDFESVFRLILEKFNKEKITFALIGGFAVHSAGFTRATTDIDFLVKKEDMRKVKEIMLSYGYELISENEDISNYLGKMEDLGEVDFLHAPANIPGAMLLRAVDKEILGGSFKAKIIIPEDIIGLKLQSSLSDSKRYAKDMLDIETLMKIHYKTLNMNIVKEYFDLFNKKDELNRIVKAVEDAE